jgi:hypothetical protein
MIRPLFLQQCNPNARNVCIGWRQKHDQTARRSQVYRTGTNPAVLKGIDPHTVRAGLHHGLLSGNHVAEHPGRPDGYDQGSYAKGHQVNNLKETEAARLRNKLLGFVFQSFNLAVQECRRECRAAALLPGCRRRAQLPGGKSTRHGGPN